ncbi:MAG: hypothetical protein ACREP9_05725 [Candidatus Dormibacteraceae bacterium]
MSRVSKLLEQWLPLLACLSGVLVPISYPMDSGSAPTAEAVPNLDQQLQQVLDCVAQQEHLWQASLTSPSGFENK